MKFAIVVFPGSNCDHDALPRGEARARAGRRVRLAQGRDPRRRRRRHPARRLLARRLPAHRRHRAVLAGDECGDGLRRRRWSGARHLQRLPDPARSGPAARRDAAQPRPEVPSASTSASASSRPTRRSPARCRQGQVLRIPIAHGEGNYFAPEMCSTARTASGAWSSATVDAAGGAPTSAANPNGAAHNIAGICNEARNVVGLMPHPERACEPCSAAPTGSSLRVGRSALASRQGAVGTRLTRMSLSIPLLLERHGLTPRRIRPDRPRARARAVRDRARHLLGDVVRALQLQELAHSSAEAPDARPARAAGARRERRRGGYRRRPGRGLQDRIAQPPVVHRALSGRGDRRRRHHPRHLHDGRPAGRAPEFAALRLARRPDRRANAAHRRRRRRRHRRLRQQHRHRRRSAARLRSRTATPAIRSSTCSASASPRPTRW